MTEGPPFERYPGPPRRDAASFRVISPWRDALAWVSTAGPLSIARYLVREAGGWRDTLAKATEGQEADVALWALARRDPVELVFRTTGAAGVGAVAQVTVTRDGCRVRVDAAGDDQARVFQLVTVPDRARVVHDDGVTWIDLPAG